MRLLLGTIAVVLQGTSASLTGTVRDSDSGRPLNRACVEVIPGPLAQCTAANGAYNLRVESGHLSVRIHRLGYRTQFVEVDVGVDPVLQLDIGLSPLPMTLTPVRVTSRRRGAGQGDTADSVVAGEVGAWSASRDQLRSRASLAGSDVLRVTALAAGIAASPEAPTSLHVRGGSGDQNLVLLDGIPLFNATHLGGLLSAVNPDVVSRVTLHAGAPSARFGDALSSVIELQTDSTKRGFRGAADPVEVRQSVTGSLPGGTGSFTLAGRRATRELIPSADDRTNTVTDLSDVFAKVSLPLGRGALEAFSFGARDRLGFSAHAFGDAKAAPIAASTLVSGRNSFDWSTTTNAVIWNGELGQGTDIRLRLWHTAFSSGAAWSAARSPLSLKTSLREAGLGADAAHRFGAGLFTTGFSVQRRTTRYQVSRQTVAAGDSTREDFIVDENAPLIALFAEHSVRTGQRWSMTAGLRGEFGAGRLPALDPRLSVRFTPVAGVTLLAGYARTHQFTQSLRNDESLLDAVVGVGLPASADGGAVPVARSDQLSVGARLAMGPGTRVSLEGYARHLDRLLLVPPVSGLPFANARAAQGTGRALGANVWFEHTSAGASVLAGYSLNLTDRTANGVRYQPTFGTTHSVAASVAYRPRSNTELHVAFWGLVGRSARVSSGDVEWPASGLLNEFTDLGGTPLAISGAAGLMRLPPYVRADVGARHDWTFSALGTQRRVTVLTGVENLFSRTNVLGVAAPQDGGPRRLLPMSRRALKIGLEWAF